MSPDNLVSFPSNSSVRPVAAICAEFCDRWHGQDVAEGARLLQTVLPARVPGALQLVIARALGELDVPAFATTEEFRAAVRRFAAGVPKLDDISDVRRARREAHVTLRRIALETNLPVHVLRQLEWGDFRDWHHEEWMRRVCHAYARAAGLNPERVITIVEAERARVLAEPKPTSYVPASARPARRGRYAAAAAATFVAGLLAGGMIVDRASEFTSLSEVADILPFGEGSTATAVPAEESDELDANGGTAADPSSIEPPPQVTTEGTTGGQPPLVAPSGPAQDQSVRAKTPARGTTPPPSFPAVAPRESVAVAQPPQLQNAITSDAANFSPSFSNVGTAFFFHRDEGVGTALMKADPDDTGGFRIVSLVQDGSRNYHVKPSPDGSKIAFDSDRDGERGVYIANADGTGVYRVSGPGFAAIPSWSPDGSRLAFVRGEPSKGSRVWNLWVLDLSSNTSVRLTSYAYGQPWGASWFPDGKRLAYSHEDTLTVLNLESGAKRTFKSPRHGRLVRTPAVSPDGRHVVFQVRHDGAWLLDLQDGSVRKILADPTAEEFAWDRTGRRLAFHSRRSGAWSVWIMSEPSGS